MANSLAVHGYAAASAKAPLGPFAFERRAPGPRDVVIDILYCGVCHSDIHQARDEWGGSIFPMVPGHEIVGRVSAIGGEVAAFRPGDFAGVGVLVDSCRVCENCREGLEIYCPQNVPTYNGRDKSGAATYGGYSSRIVVDEAYTLRITHPPEQLAAVAPLLCAGITTYSPLRHWGAGPGKTVGIIGLGGLGHMGVKLAHALGARTVLFTTSKGKVADGHRLGADAVVLSTDASAMRSHLRSLDFILDTAAGFHDLNPYLGLLKRDGTLALVGVPPQPFTVAPFSLISGRRSLAGSAVGGMRELQEMLDFCAARGIVSDIEITPISAVNQAFERVVRGDVKYRFVIDLATLGGGSEVP